MSNPYGTAADPSGNHCYADPLLPGVENSTTSAHGSQQRAALGLQVPRDEAFATASHRPPMGLSEVFISTTKWRITTAGLSRSGSPVNVAEGGISHDQ